VKDGQLGSAWMKCTLLALVVLLVGAAPGISWSGESTPSKLGAGAEEPARSTPDSARPQVGLEEIVPKRIQISVGADHIFGVTELHVWPKDLGETSWARWDSDGDRRISLSEQNQLLKYVAHRELLSLRVAAVGRRVDWGSFDVTRMAVPGADLGLSEAVDIKISGRLALDSLDEERVFVVYALPRTPDGIVPLRISLARGMSFFGVAGARAEQRGPRRIEAVLSRSSPALWGVVRRQP